MKRWLLATLAVAWLASPARAQEPVAAASPESSAAAEAETEPFTLEAYHASTVPFGVPFYTHYPASIYTGFAPRVEDPNRIHFRAGRGNQVRLTAVLDEYAVLTYLYGLRKREEAFERAASAGMFEMKGTRHLDAYRKIVDSPVYDIRGTLAAFEAGELTRPRFYEKSLETLSRLNPERVHPIDIDLAAELTRWREDVRAYTEPFEGDPADAAAVRAFIEENPNDSIVLSDAMVFGRVNAVHLDDAERDQLAALVAAAHDAGTKDAAFVGRALAYFESVTDGRYALKTVADGDFVPAIQCADPGKRCRLRYPEFTSVYPNGSAIASITDRHGNAINLIRNNGLMTFLARRYHDVDHIRSEGYYGYAPKMDWQAIGNGVHNPGVSHHLPSMKHLYTQLDIPEDYQFLWVPSRGPVSSGCVRVSQGALWEVRHIFPADTERMNELHYFGNASEDYDVFDIDADGTPEVIGSEYYIAYSLRGASGDAKRRGKGFSMDNATREDFYPLLYGEVGQFEREGESYWFPTPYVTHFRKEEAEDKQGRAISRALEGRYRLYEHPYERDKVQVYHLTPKYRGDLKVRDNRGNTGKHMVRIFGRVSSCGPFASEWSDCYEEEFDREFAELLAKL